MGHRPRSKPLKKSGSSRNPASREKYNLQMQGKSTNRAWIVHPGMSGESGTFEPLQNDLSGETMLGQPKDRMLSGEPGSKRPRDKVLSGESRNITDRPEHNEVEPIRSSDDSRPQSWENTSETTSNSDVSEIAIHSLLVEWKQRELDREMHQDPDRDSCTSDEEGTVVENAADELELIAVSKRLTRLLPSRRDLKASCGT